MKRRLHKPHASEVLLASALEDRFHQLSADTAILGFRVHGDWSYAGDIRPLIETVTAEEVAIGLGYYTIESGV